MMKSARHFIFIAGILTALVVFFGSSFYSLEPFWKSRGEGVKSVTVRAIIKKAVPSPVPSVIPPKPSPAVPREPEMFYTYPSFEKIVFRGTVLLLIILLLLAPVVVLIRWDVSFFSFPILLRFLWREFWFFFKGERRPVWGRVYALNVSSAVFLARLRVYNFSGELLGEDFTNLSGRFGFSLPKDRYVLEVSKPGYELVRVEGDVVELDPGEYVYNYEEGKEVLFFMEKSSPIGISSELWGEELALEICDFLLILGFLFSIFRCISYPSVLNAFIFSLYLLYLFFWTSWLR